MASSELNQKVQAKDWSDFSFIREFLPDRILIHELNISNENFTLHVHKLFSAILT